MKKKNHMLLQFTGFYDIHKDEICELVVLHMHTKDHVTVWNVERTVWNLTALEEPTVGKPLIKPVSDQAVRICNYFETKKGEPLK